MTDVIIIGAGSAKLSAAKALTKLGLNSTVIEDAHRIGGSTRLFDPVFAFWWCPKDRL